MTSPNDDDKAAVKLAIAGFRSKLLREFPAWTSGDLSGFRNFVIGTLKATLPRQRAGRKANPTVIRAHDLYMKSQNANRPVSWHAIAQVVVPGYREAPPAIQKAMRLKLRAKIHSYRHSLKQRTRLSDKRKEFPTPHPTASQLQVK